VEEADVGVNRSLEMNSKSNERELANWRNGHGEGEYRLEATVSRSWKKTPIFTERIRRTKGSPTASCAGW
jgi:hypothetical protein